MSKNYFSTANLTWYTLFFWQLYVYSSTFFCLVDTYLSYSMKKTVPAHQDISITCNTTNNNIINNDWVTDIIDLALVVAVFYLFIDSVTSFILLSWKLTWFSEYVKVEDKDRLAEKVYQGIMFRRSNPGVGEDIGPVTRLFLGQCIYLPLILVLNEESCFAIHKLMTYGGNNRTDTVGTNHTLADDCGEPFRITSLADLSTTPILLMLASVLQCVLLMAQLVGELVLTTSSRIRTRVLCRIGVDEDVARRLSPQLDMRALELLVVMERVDIVPKLLSLLSNTDVKAENNFLTSFS